jgi:hypothetical protein
MTESSIAIGCDVTESDVTGSDVIRSKVGDSPRGVILIVSNATFGHEQWYILYYYYSKKKGGDALPGMRRIYFR